MTTGIFVPSAGSGTWVPGGSATAILDRLCYTSRSRRSAVRCGGGIPSNLSKSNWWT